MIGLSFFPYLTAHQNIEYYRKLKGIEDKKETERVLKLVELYGETKPFKAFSMGMKQRLGIANALLGSPKIIILDEPIN
ncbi:MAG: ATP-binding cassette domain-containing protein [Candidatus Peribacteria bacterium]|jgi:ABC-2 type transport system ATP-binding protein|nr:ATP-binding cassette domain-containing protein [Candidatus Peribacteria bacterium]